MKTDPPFPQPWEWESSERTPKERISGKSEP